MCKLSACLVAIAEALNLSYNIIVPSNSLLLEGLHQILPVINNLQSRAKYKLYSQK